MTPTSTRERIARLEEALDRLVNNFAWSAVRADCDESRDYLESLIDQGRALLSGAPFVEEKGLGSDVAVEGSTPGQGATREGLQELRALSEKAAPGPWEEDTVDSEGGYGHFKAYAVSGPDGKTICDTHNSEVATLHEEHDEDGRVMWDETGRNDMKFAASAVNFVRALLSSGSEATTASPDSRGTSVKDHASEQEPK